ncbi:hypothetical protein GCM10011391_11000 [Pullulanibacillus camelliae]|uniref:Uncharacterized protein n=1 Tax=Pullulanibacillus camelliae TaxID=1707096 RepID=A0A8J2VP91_9BACL|nr:hypothetical protein [Pullulanibacillus camelliae]GGE34075.1 hypothetical protein GCM10011391_11000 [Pullulanibacillus camelliae]
MKEKQKGSRQQEERPKVTLDKSRGLGRPQTPPPQPKDYEEIDY